MSYLVISIAEYDVFTGNRLHMESFGDLSKGIQRYNDLQMNALDYDDHWQNVSYSLRPSSCEVRESGYNNHHDYHLNQVRKHIVESQANRCGKTHYVNGKWVGKSVRLPKRTKCPDWLIFDDTEIDHLLNL